MNTWRSQSDGVSSPTVLPARMVLTVLLVLFGTLSAAGRTPGREMPTMDGRSPRDLKMEEFLRRAEIVTVEQVGEGITRPQRLTLRREGVEHRAIFKTVDVMIRDVVRTNRYETCFRDSYRFEVAAYLLDRRLGVGLVPVTVLREVDGQMGSLQEWIEDVSNLRQALESPDRTGRGDEHLLRERLTSMYVLDSLICNIDRNHDNILVNPRQDRFFLIDHSRAFRTFRKVTPPRQEQSVLTLAPEMVGRIKSLAMSELNDQLGELLTKAQIKALMKRRDGLLDALGRSGLLPDVGPPQPS